MRSALEGEPARQEVTAAVINYLWDIAVRLRPVSGEEGQGLVEYGLILVLIAVVAVVSLTFIGTQIQTQLSSVGNSV